MRDSFCPDCGDFAAHIEKYRQLLGWDVDSPVTEHIWVPHALRVSDRCTAVPFGPTQGWSNHTGKEQIVPKLDKEVSQRKRKPLKK